MPGTPAEIYPDILALQDIAIGPTCSLNNGVCHNGNNYPDLHTINNVVATTWAPCGVDVATVDLLFDECEPPGDRLVLSSAGVELEILEVAVSPSDADYRDLTHATLTVAGDASTVPIGATDVTIVRDDQVFDLGAVEVSVESVADDTVVLELAGPYGEWSAKWFLDARTLPWTPDRVRVGDPNGNGIAGAAEAVPLLTPGDPANSYLFLRLVDESYGDLMPRQCRTWDDRATRALGCWIEGLTVGNDGMPDNALDPIDYDACTVGVEGLGRCETILGDDLESIETILEARCGGTTCHIGDGPFAQGLDLSPGGVIEALVDVPSTVTGLPLVVPGDSAASYLVCKLDPDCADRQGAVMPSAGDVLAEPEVVALRAWIDAGATAD
jgi:hypothetical protein